MPARPARTTTAAVILALFLTSCSLGGSDQEKADKAAQETLNQSEVTRIQDELSRDPRIKNPDMGYNNDFPTSGSSSIGVFISPEDRDQVEQIADLCTRTIWLSRISPLRSMHIDVGWKYPDGTTDGITRFYPLDSKDDTEPLRKFYGERPVPG